MLILDLKSSVFHSTVKRGREKLPKRSEFIDFLFASHAHAGNLGKSTHFAALRLAWHHPTLKKYLCWLFTAIRQQPFPGCDEALTRLEDAMTKNGKVFLIDRVVKRNINCNKRLCQRCIINQKYIRSMQERKHLCQVFMVMEQYQK